MFLKFQVFPSTTQVTSIINFINKWENLVATGESNQEPTIHIWSIISLEPFRLLQTWHKGGIVQLAFSRCGKMIISIGYEKNFSIQATLYNLGLKLEIPGNDSFPKLPGNDNRPCDKPVPKRPVRDHLLLRSLLLANRGQAPPEVSQYYFAGLRSCWFRRSKL